VTAAGVPGAGHACDIEDPATFNAQILEFLENKGLPPNEAP